MTGFYDVGPLSQVAINLFYGWGYNFYRLENQLRADDQLVRARASAYLTQARAAVEAAELAYRREHLPPPTRANPAPDPAAVANAQAIERLSRGIGALEAQIRTQPTPENDRMTQRHRQEAQTLQALIACDQTLIGQCDLMSNLVEQACRGELVGEIPRLEEGMAAIAATLRARAAALLA
jgi:hypothetical protein